MQARNKKKSSKIFGGSNGAARRFRAPVRRALSSRSYALVRPARMLGIGGSAASVGNLTRSSRVTERGIWLSVGEADSPRQTRTQARPVTARPGPTAAEELALFFEKNRQLVLSGAESRPKAFDVPSRRVLGAVGSARGREAANLSARIGRSSARRATAAGFDLDQRSRRLRYAAAPAPRRARRAARGPYAGVSPTPQETRAGKKVLTDRSDDVRFCPERR